MSLVTNAFPFFHELSRRTYPLWSFQQGFDGCRVNSESMHAPPAGASARTAYLFLTLSSLAFGGTWVAGKLAVSALAPLLIAALRFAIASVLLWGWARTVPQARPRLAARDLPMVLGLGLTAPAGGTLLFVYGLRLAPASDGTIITAGVGPVLSAALAAIVLRERTGRWAMAGFAAAFLGLLLVIRPGGPQNPDRLIGDLLFLASAACWAVYALLGRTATRRFTPVGATFYATVTATILLLPLAILEHGWGTLLHAPSAAVIGLLYLAIVGTVVSFVFLFEGINQIGVTRAASFVLLIPVFGVSLAALVLGERVSVMTLAGGALVLLGLWLVQRDSGSVSAS